MKRVPTPELLDTDAGTEAEVNASLGDLRRINRWFGGIATTEDMVERVAREIKASSLSLLEVAAGNGYRGADQDDYKNGGNNAEKCSDQHEAF